MVAILISNYSKFINWSKRNNVNILKFRNTVKNIDSFGNLILEEYENMNFNEKLNENLDEKLNLIRIPNDSLRMSIISVI